MALLLLRRRSGSARITIHDFIGGHGDGIGVLVFDNQVRLIGWDRAAGRIMPDDGARTKFQKRLVNFGEVVR